SVQGIPENRTGPRGALPRDQVEALRAGDEDRKEARRGGPAAPPIGAVRRSVLDAGHDGFDPEPRHDRQRCRADGDPRERPTVRSGRLPATGPDVRSDRAGRSGRGFRGTAGPDEEAAWGRPRPRDTRVRDGRDRSGVQGTGPGQDRPTVPPGPLAAARGGGERGLPVVGEPESPGVPTVL